MKIAISQLEIFPSILSDNLIKILEDIEKAKKNNADIIVFPELCVSGYLLGDLLESESFVRECENFGNKIIEASNDIYVIFGNIAIDRNKLNFDGRIRKYNALFVAKDGKLIQNASMPYPFFIKTLLPNYKEFEDPRHFYSLKNLALENNISIEEYLKPLEIEIKNKKYKLGLTICEDIWSENYPIVPIDIIARNNDIDLFINISSSPYSIKKDKKRIELCSNIAKKYKTPFVYVNNVGIQNNGKTVYTFDGNSCVYNSNGEIVFKANRYEENLYFVDNFEKSLSNNEIKDEYDNIYSTLKYGISNFMKQLGLKKVVIGVSGGIDSALSAAVYVDTIGADNVLLVNMPSKYNSNTTKNLAKELAINLGCWYGVFPIEESVKLTINQLENIPIEKNNEKEFLKVSSFISENIQARDRSSRILSAISASFGGVFTCNANKTETMIGYSTLYGDSAGFFAAFADLWKYQIYELANFVNNKIYKKEVIPQGSINIVPSAELSLEQDVDSGKGDPIKYDYHDYLFKTILESWNKIIPEDILRWYMEGVLEEKIGCSKGIIKKYFKNNSDFIEDLEKWWKQYVTTGVFKRIQSPPILSISGRTFGFSNRESQMKIYYTSIYFSLKSKLLNLHS